MAKADLELVKMVLTRNEVDTRLVADIIKEIMQESAAEVDEDKEPAIKKQYVVVVYDPENELEGKEFTGSIVQIPEDESVYTAVEKLHRAGYEFNTTKKGRRMPVKTVGEVCEHVPARIAKEQKVWIKHKEPCFLLATDGLLPTDKTAATQKRRVEQTPLFAGEPEEPGFEKRLEAAMCSLEDTWKKTNNADSKAALEFLNLWAKDKDAAKAFPLTPKVIAVIKATMNLARAVHGQGKALADALSAGKEGK